MTDKNEPLLSLKKPTIIGKSYCDIIDSQLNIEQNKLMVTLNYLNKKEEIEKLAKALKGDIKRLSKSIQDILDKHHKDYITTFTTFMDSVRQDLKLKLEQIEKIEKEKNKLNDIDIIKLERDYFRSECIRLTDLWKTLDTKINDMKLKMKVLTDEVNNVTFKWKDSETTNKQLFLELESNLRKQKDLERELEEMKELLDKSKNDPFNNNINNITPFYSEEEEEEEEFQKERVMSIIERLKLELKRERMKSHQAMLELNKYLSEKNKLENIFIDCVEETRKSILNRRLKDSIMYNTMKDGYYKFDKGISTKYETFLQRDKKAILENFVFNEEVNNVIREAIFNKPNKEREMEEMRKRRIEKINLFNLPQIELSDSKVKSDKNIRCIFNRTVKGTTRNFSEITKKHIGFITVPFKIK